MQNLFKRYDNKKDILWEINKLIENKLISKATIKRLLKINEKQFKALMICKDNYFTLLELINFLTKLKDVKNKKEKDKCLKKFIPYCR